MARGVRVKTINMQIQEVSDQIIDFQEKLSNLKIKKKSLLESKEKEELCTLKRLIDEKGVSIEDIINNISLNTSSKSPKLQEAN